MMFDVNKLEEKLITGENISFEELFQLEKHINDFSIEDKIDLFLIVKRVACYYNTRLLEMGKDTSDKTEIYEEKVQYYKKILEIDDKLKKNTRIKSLSNIQKSIINKEIILAMDKVIYFSEKKSSELINKGQYLLLNRQYDGNAERILNIDINLCDKKYVLKILSYKLHALIGLGKYEEVCYLFETVVLEYHKKYIEYKIDFNSCCEAYALCLKQYDVDKLYSEMDKLKPHISDGMYYICMLRIGMVKNDKHIISELYKHMNSQSNKEPYLEASLLKFLNDGIFTDEIKERYYINLKQSGGLDKLDKFEMCDCSNIILNILNEKMNNTNLYHYTSLDALKGILENNMFWVTASDFLNDSSETKYISDYVDKLLELSKQSEIYECLNKVALGIRYYFDSKIESNLDSEIVKYIDDNIKPNLKRVYILSLSTNSDSITLWGNYSKNDGYNLGFNTEKLMIRLKNLNSPKVRPETIINNKVIYKKLPNDREDICKDFLFKEIKSYHTYAKDYDISDNIIVCGLIYNILIIGLFLKKDYFSHEEEYRIIFALTQGSTYSNIDENFRSKDGALIPFIKVPFSSDCITSVGIGPSNKSDIAQQGIKRFLEKNSYPESTEIIPSEIPLRY